MAERRGRLTAVVGSVLLMMSGALAAHAAAAEGKAVAGARTLRPSPVPAR